MRNRNLMIIICLTFGIYAGVRTHVFANPADRAQSSTRPWSGYWWPLREARMLEPLSKYDRITGRKSATWERKFHAANDQTPKWHGYCHAWAASSVLEPEPKRTILIPVSATEKIRLSVGDQKGLLAACHAQDVANTYGDRYGDQVGSEDRRDLAPDQLWRLLSLYVKQQQIPLILDIESGPEVWNYPVFAYRVDQRAQNDGWHVGSMTLWMADNGVPTNFVGIQVRRHVYHFQFRMVDDAVVAGSSKWIGRSVKDHPDFAWYPFLAKPENPELDVAIVRNILSGNSRDGADSVTTDEVPSNERVNENREEHASHVNTAPAELAERGNAPTNNDLGGNRSRVEARLLSPIELLKMVTRQTSDFALDVTVDRFDGATYQEGERLSVRVSSQKSGWLHLFRVAPDGDLSLIYPMAGDDNYVEANNSTTLPRQNAGYEYLASGPAGVHRIKAVVTSKPIKFTGLTLQQQTEAGPHKRAFRFRWHPTQRLQIQQLLRAYAKDPVGVQNELAPVKVRSELGKFAQDEVVFHIATTKNR